MLAAPGHPPAALPTNHPDGNRGATDGNARSRAGRAPCPGQQRGRSRLCPPSDVSPAPAEPRGAAWGEAAPDWNHIEAHLQRIRPGASSACLAVCAANLWGLSAPPRFPQRMFPGQSAAGLRRNPRQHRRRGARVGTPMLGGDVPVLLGWGGVHGTGSTAAGGTAPCWWAPRDVLKMQVLV